MRRRERLGLRLGWSEEGHGLVEVVLPFVEGFA